MAKGKKDFFAGSGKLKLQREIEAGRDTKSGNKGFMKELSKRDQRREEYRSGKEYVHNEDLFRGKDVAPQRKPEKIEADWMKEDPTEKKIDINQGSFQSEANWNASKKGLK